MKYSTSNTTEFWQRGLPAPNDDTMLKKQGILMQASSLTYELKQYPTNFFVYLLHLGEQAVDQTDPIYIHDKFAKESNVWVREVVLYSGFHAVISARSVCAENSLYWKDILDCGNHSLGNRLFNTYVAYDRSPFEYARLPETHPLVKPYSKEPLWARRSVFSKDNDRLLLTECFLPGLLKIKKPS